MINRPPGGVATGARPVDAAGVQTLAPGFLIAMPQLGDPNFHRAVVLMLEHNEEGSRGLIINRASGLTLDDLAQGQSMQIAEGRREEPIFMGGPVEPQRGFVLHDDETAPEKQQVLPGLFLSVTLDALGPLLEQDGSRVRFCLGYAGWGPKQLEQELSHGSWLFSEASGEHILEGDPDRLWSAVLGSMGVDPAMLVAGSGFN